MLRSCGYGCGYSYNIRCFQGRYTRPSTNLYWYVYYWYQRPTLLLWALPVGWGLRRGLPGLVVSVYWGLGGFRGGRWGCVGLVCPRLFAGGIEGVGLQGWDYRGGGVLFVVSCGGV